MNSRKHFFQSCRTLAASLAMLVVAIIGMSVITSRSFEARQQVLAVTGVDYVRPQEDDGPASGQVPTWLGDAREKDRHDNTRDNTYVLETNPCGTEHQAREELHERIRETIAKHISKILPAAQAKRLVDFLRDDFTGVIFENRQTILPYEDENVRKVANEFNIEDASYFKGYAHLNFESDYLQTIISRNQELMLRDRLIMSGLLGLGLVGCLTVVFGFLKMNHATRGLHSKRLQLTGTLCLLGLSAVVWLLWKSLL